MKNKKYLIVSAVVLGGFIGLGIYFAGKQNKISSSPELSSVEEIKPTFGDWKTYSNRDYDFRMDYPSRFAVVEDSKPDDFYDTLATFTFESEPNESITLRAIRDIDIYKNEKPENVAKREVGDSGSKYNITTTKIGEYLAAITTFDVVYPEKKSLIVTISHPEKNLFVVLDINADLSRVDFEQLLASFKFTDLSVGKL